MAVLPHTYRGSGVAFTADSADSAEKTWTAKFGVVGMAGFGKAHWLLDGLNTAGVSAHLLYMPGGYCTYQPHKGDGTDLSEVDVIAFLLGTCESIADVKTAIAEVNVWGYDPGMGFAPPTHILIHDAKESIAIEFHPGGLTVVDNPTSVGTNSPYNQPTNARQNNLPPPHS